MYPQGLFWFSSQEKWVLNKLYVYKVTDSNLGSGPGGGHISDHLDSFVVYCQSSGYCLCIVF